MKKILLFLTIISFISINFFLNISCINKKEDENLKNIKLNLEKYIEKPFFVSLLNITNKEFEIQLYEKISKFIKLGDYKLIVEGNEKFIKPKITNNYFINKKTKEINELYFLQEQNVKDELYIVNGSANVSVFKKNEKKFNIKIKWVANELIFLRNIVNKINNSNIKNKNINLPLPKIIKGLNINFSDLYNFIEIISLPEKEIMEINLSEIIEPDFIIKFDNIINIFIENANKIGLNIDKYFDKEISFSKIIVGKGTIKDLLHNIAPDLISFLQWFIIKGKAQIKLTHNVIFPIIQYLLSPVNLKLKENIKDAFGDDFFYKNTILNLDSLFFHTLCGYRNDYEETDSKYKFSLDILFFGGPINQNNNRNIFFIKFNPTLLIKNILNIFSKKGNDGIDAINTNIIIFNKSESIITDIIFNFINIKFFLGPQLMFYAGTNILYNSEISNTELKNNNIVMISGVVKLQIKTKDGEWKNLVNINNNDNDNNTNLIEILNAFDFKLNFTNVKFKITSKNNDNINYETNGKYSFDLWLSDNYY